MKEEEVVSFEIINREGHPENDLIQYLNSAIEGGYTKEVFDWQYRSSSKSVFTRILNKRNETKGTQGYIHYKVRFQNKTYHTVKSETSHLSPELRGKNLFTPLYEFGVQNLDKIYTIWGMTFAGKVWEDKLRFSSTPSILDETTIVLRWNKKAQNGDFSAKNLLRRILITLKVILLRTMLLAGNVKNLSTETTDCVSPDIIAFVQNNYKKDEVSMLMDEKFFEMRFDKNPFQNYNYIKVIGSDNQLLSFAVFSKSNSGILNILSAKFTNRESVKKLVFELIKFAINDKQIWCIKHIANLNNNSNSIFSRHLHKYMAKSYPLPFFWVRRDITESLPLNLAQWRVDGAWTEGRNF